MKTKAATAVTEQEKKLSDYHWHATKYTISVVITSLNRYVGARKVIDTKDVTKTT